MIKQKIWRLIYIVKSIYQSYFPIKKQVFFQSNQASSKKTKKRVLIIIHENFLTNKGGVENYALNLYEAFRKKDDFDFFYLCRVNTKNRGVGEIWQDNSKKNLYYINLRDGNVYSLVDFRFDKSFENFLLSLIPDVVHFQHYLHFSLSWFSIIKKSLPKTKIILTIHEFLAICPNSGQMIKTKWQKNKLCYKSNVSDCSKCFPYMPKKVLEKRKKYVDEYFDFVDLFISPSKFVLERHVNYGIDKNKIIYSENGQNVFEAKNKTSTLKLKLLYVGQINEFKGLHLLLDSMKKLVDKDIALSIYGKFQDNDYKKKIEKIISSLSNVKYYGPYQRNELSDIFASNDLLIVPSVWWENSPLVIQESFIAKTPVLCSNIGGMREKVTNGFNGMHFKTGDTEDLTKKIMSVYLNRDILKKLTKNIKPVKSIESNCDELISIYKTI